LPTAVGTIVLAGFGAGLGGQPLPQASEHMDRPEPVGATARPGRTITPDNFRARGRRPWPIRV